MSCRRPCRPGGSRRPRLTFTLGLAAVSLAAGCGGAGKPGATPGPRPSLVTVAEASGFTRTGRYEEVRQLCRDFAAAYPERARCHGVGTTPEGREMVSLVVSDDGVLTPRAAVQAKRPVIVIQGGIHAGEIEGKDAGFLALREALDGTLAPGGLRAATVVFVPVFNVDGHERFGPNNRPNQRGPEEMGFRTTAQNLNLNRDYMKAEAPEMAAMLRLLEDWGPQVYVDLHTTDGARFEHDIAVMVTPVAPRDDQLDEAGRALSDALQARLTALGHLPLPFYPSFITDDDPASGFVAGEAPPRFSHFYAAARGMLGILVETHSWRTYPERVKSTRNLIAALLERAVTDGPSWLAATGSAVVADRKLAGRDVVLMYTTTPQSRPIEFRGYAYERRPSEVSGAMWISYDETKPQVWTVPYFDQLTPAVTVTAPKGGYLIPSAFAELVAAKLGLHAIEFHRLSKPRPGLDVEAFRAATVELKPTFEGRAPVKVTGTWTRERQDLGAGALWVPIDQPEARVILHLLEPTAPDSLVAWGFFNAAFERKEYLDGYVTEDVARTMLADPAVRAEFEARLAADPAFAASPAQRLEFFQRRHPSWDTRLNLVPVFRADEAPEAFDTIVEIERR